MKKIVCMFLTFAMLNMFAYAAEYPRYTYGCCISTPGNVEGSAATYILCRNDAGYTTGRSQETAHSGRYAFKIECTSAASGSAICYERTSNIAGIDTLHNKILVEMFVKGFDTKPSSVSFFLYLTDYNNVITTSTLKCEEETDADGWHRVWTILPKGEYKTVRYGTTYTRKSYDSIKNYYIDDMNDRYLPEEMKVDDGYAGNGVFDLKKLKMRGIDSTGKIEPIVAVDNVEFEVLSGNAYINDKQQLVYTGAEGGTVNVKAKLYEVSATFNLTFGGQVTVGEVAQNDSGYSVSVNNGSNGSVDALLAVCVFDGERLSSVKTVSETVDSGALKTISCTMPDTEFYVENPVVKAYAYTIRR